MTARTGWPARLADPRLYRTLLERLELKYQSCHRSELLQGSLPTRQLLHDQGTLARLLAQTIADETYRAAPGCLRPVKIGKMRSLFTCNLTDFLVHGAVAEVLTQALANELSPNLYSYRRGTSRLDALRAFAGYTRRHRRLHPSPRDRGLFVLRRDVSAYTDSIPVDRASPLWTDLRSLADRTNAALTPFVWSLLEGVLRPTLRGADGEYCLGVGVPTGSPVSPALANLYLAPLDAALGAIEGSFYARYGDDFVFAHGDPDVARAASSLVDSVLRDRRLSLNREKAADLFFNGAGRPSSRWPAAAPRSTVDFLGARLTFHGTIGLKDSKTRALLGDLEARAQRSARALGHVSAEVRGRVVCRVLNQALDRRSPLATPGAAVLLTAFSDRRQLRDLDYRIARLVATVVTGESGVKAFRRVPYRTIRDDWQLVSLEYTRNARPVR